jgi:drug/metabolite transporter (DMT)-like permease
MPSAPDTASAERPRLGILFMCLSVVLLTVMDAMAKHMAASYPLAQVVWARYAFTLVGLLVLLPVAPVAVWRSGRPDLQLLRGLGMIAATGLMFLSVKLLPLAEAYAIAFVSPLLVAVFAGITLGEHVGARRWLAAVVGFVGVLVIVRPGAGALGAAALAPLGMAACYALYQLVTRKLASVDHAFVTMFWSASVGTAVASAVTVTVWQPPDVAGWGLMVSMGVLGLLGQLAMIRAFTLGPASAISPYIYTQIVWAVLIGLWAFGDWPDGWTLLGASVVVAGGLWLFAQESRRG